MLRIAGQMGISASTVRHHTRDLKVETTHKCVYRRASQSEAVALPFSSDLAYLIGVICGDGCLTQLPRTCQLIISCDARYLELTAKYVDLIEKLVGRKPSVLTRKNGSYFEIRLANKSFSTMFGLPVGAKAHDYPVPEWIFEDLNFVRPFLRGLIETDSGVYHEYRNGGWCSRCLFTNKCDSIMRAFLRGSAALGYNFRHVPTQFQARLTISAQVIIFAKELDLTKERVYIQKGQQAKPRSIY